MADSSYPRGKPYKPPPEAPSPLEPINLQPPRKEVKPAPVESAPPASPTIRKSIQELAPAPAAETNWAEISSDETPSRPRRDSGLLGWMVFLTLATIIIVVVTAGVSVFLIYKTVRPADQARTDTSPTSATSEKGTEKTTAAKVQPVQPPKEVPLEALGWMSVAHLQQSFYNIGFLADASEVKVYEKDQAKKMLNHILRLMAKVDEQLAKLGESGLNADDLKRLKRIREAAAILQVEARELLAYWDTPDSEPALKKDREQKFHKARQEAEATIKDVLGSPPEPKK